MQQQASRLLRMTAVPSCYRQLFLLIHSNVIVCKPCTTESSCTHLPWGPGASQLLSAGGRRRQGGDGVTGQPVHCTYSVVQRRVSCAFYRVQVPLHFYATILQCRLAITRPAGGQRLKRCVIAMSAQSPLPMLPRRPLGRTGLEVSVLGFGASPLGGVFQVLTPV